MGAPWWAWVIGGLVVLGIIGAIAGRQQIEQDSGRTTGDADAHSTSVRQ